MIKSEADILVKKKNKKDPNWFCPLIRDLCEKNCLNYGSAFVFNPNTPPNENLVDAKRNDFEVQSPYCSNAIFTEISLMCPHGKDREEE